MRILNYIKLAIHKCKWRMNNRHNQTIAVSIFPCKNVNVGKNTYGPLELIWFPNAMDAKVKIGCYCSIGLSVKFLVGGVITIIEYQHGHFRQWFINKKEIWT